jgi:hypothetical protein
MAKKRASLAEAAAQYRERKGETVQEVVTQTVEAPKPAEEPSGPTFQRTSTGYVSKDGELRVRVSLHLTKSQRRRLREAAAGEGFDNITSYVVDRLDLDLPR